MSIDDETPGSTRSRESAGSDVSVRTGRRASSLDRMLATTGFVRQHSIRVTADGITGDITAPARLIHQSLAPVLASRGIGYRIDRDPEVAEAVVTATLFDTRNSEA